MRGFFAHDSERLIKTLRQSSIVLFLLLAVGAPGASQAQDFTVNLKETDIQELIKFVAEATDTTIVVDPSVKGKVPVAISKTDTPRE